jgi:putative DNA primase/helicase
MRIPWVDGIWERIKLIPFTVTIPESERDRKLTAKLEAEAPGILRWMVEGCLEWHQRVSCPPDEVRTATADYRAEMDVLDGFLDDCCLRSPDARVNATALFRAYQDWCKESGEHAENRPRFVGRLGERGFVKERAKDRNRAFQWVGRWWKVSEVATMLSLSARQVYYLIQEGKMPGVKVEGSIRVRADPLDLWMADKEVAATESRTIYGTKARVR